MRSFGTEGRKPGAEIPPSDEIYTFINFRGSDIKDLSIIQMTPAPEPKFQDSAIISSSTTLSPSTSLAPAPGPKDTKPSPKKQAWGGGKKILFYDYIVY